MRFAVAAKDADGESQFKANIERLGEMIQKGAVDEPVLVSKSDVPSDEQIQQPKKSWKQWLTGK
jgi:Flp pilus assembly protein CpaB